MARSSGVAAAAKVRLHLWVSAEEGFLTAAQIKTDVPGWRDADIWFCGPVAFGNSLRKDLVGEGLPAGDFHQELFHLR